MKKAFIKKVNVIISQTETANLRIRDADGESG